MAEPPSDPYALLSLTPAATPQELKTAYRKLSLKVHPDRNPDNPDAATLFHALNAAFTLLSDPLQRAQLDAKLVVENAKKQRFAALDSKRKAMAQDLEDREREFKRRKEDEGRENVRKGGELERLKEQGRKMREARAAAAAAPSSVPTTAATAAPTNGNSGGGGATDLGPLDKTLKLKWLISSHPSLVSPSSIGSHLSTLLSPSPAGIDSVVISSKTLAFLSPSSSLEKKKLKHGTGVVGFSTLSAAVRVYKAAAVGSKKGWEGIEVSWAAGEAPEAVRSELAVFESGRVKSTAFGQEKGNDASARTVPPSFDAPIFASIPPPSSASSAASTAPASEDSILAALRAREKERERLMEEMRRQDEEEESAGGA